MSYFPANLPGKPSQLTGSSIHCDYFAITSHAIAIYRLRAATDLDDGRASALDFYNPARSALMLRA
jgi:hypothetical protein